MAEILIRAGMFPGKEPDAITCWKKNLIANNSGNMLFAESVMRAICNPDDNYTVTYSIPKNVEEINERYSAFVLPFANGFRKSFTGQLRGYTELIRKLKIPCVVVGIGAQTNLNHSLLDGSEIDDDVRAFVSAVLDKSHSIGVRGHFTAEYLSKLGFKSSVNVIGCPSMYMHQGKVRVNKKSKLPEKPAIAVNMTPHLPENICNWFRGMWRKYPSSLYVMQDRGDMELLLWGKPNKAMKKGDATPALLNHPYITRNRARLFVNVPSWLNEMREQDFSIGTRIHGNIFALLAGTPAMLIAHDSRTLEMAEFYHIPYVRGSEIDENISIRKLYEQADFSVLEKNLPIKFNNYCEFLRSNGLNPAFALEGELQSRSFCAGIEPITALKDIALRERIVSLHKLL